MPGQAQDNGLPVGAKFYSPFPFAGMNLNASAIAIDDREFTWLENFIRVGDGKLRTAYDVGAALYTAPMGKTIVYFFFYTIGTNYYVAVFLSDGSALQVAWPSGAQTTIATAGTFYQGSSGFLPACAQWGVLYLLISNRNSVNDYWIWDGALLYAAGTAAPNGAILTSGGINYNTLPTLTVYGGHGSGVAITPVINAGSVVNLEITNPGSGYQVGDIPQIQFSGGGSDTGAILTASVANGTVAAVNITAPGTGYGAPPTVGFSGGGGTGAAAVATVGGGVSGVSVTAPGSGYSTASVSFSGGGGSDAAATATITGGVTGVAITNGGTGYTGSISVAFFGGGGTGAAATATATAGVITSITVTNPGTGYTSDPTVTITGSVGTGATAVSAISGIVSAITVTDPGQNYTSAPSVVITGDGSGATATATVTASGVVTVTITNPGSGYTSAPSVSFTPVSGGSGATAVALLSPTGLGAVTVTNAGTGYFYPPLIQFVGGNGSGATGVTFLEPTSFARVNVTSGGQNYELTPTVKILNGDSGGSGAFLRPFISAGSVISINVNSAGSGYTTSPELFIVPDNLGKSNQDTGTGATATAIMNPVPIGSVMMMNYGTGYSDAPAIEITPGANNSAYGLLSLMPFGLSGSTIETFQDRVWIGNPAPGEFSTLPPGGDFSVTAAGSYTDVAASAGGVIFTNSDRFLQTQYVAIRQSNSYIYFLGDGSISVGSNVQTTGNPPVTTFNYQTVDTVTGCSWRDSVADFGRSIIFANQTGVFGLYGGAAQKTSAKLDDLFLTASFPPSGGALTPSASVATIFNIKHYLMLMTVKDPDLGTNRNVMVTWNEREWSITSQTPALTFIGPQKVQTEFTTWGTDGAKLYPLFQTPSTTLVKRLDTKQYGAPQSFMTKRFDSLYVQASDMSGTGAGVAFTADFVVSGKALQPENLILENAPSGVHVLTYNPAFPSPSPFFGEFGGPTGDVYFVTGQIRITTASPDFILGNLMLCYVDEKADHG